jgi:antitoxin HicB
MNKYSFTVAWSDEDEGYIALCPEFSGLSGIGDTVEEAIAELQVALEGAIEVYRAEGWALPEPRRLAEHSGKVLLRMPKGLHGRLVQQAEAEGVSLNTLVVTLLSEAIGLTAGVSRAEHVITKVLHSWNTNVVQAIAAIVSQRRVTSGTTWLRYNQERKQLSEVRVASSQSQARYISQLTGGPPSRPTR